eukprot:15474840-Alexandrium_andersonii.AAC.1
MAKQNAGSMMHNILGRALAKAYPDHSEQAPDQGVDEYRAMVRNKRVRAKLVLNSEVKRRRFALINWIARPLSHMHFRIQWMDERGKSLQDLATPRMSPFEEARRALIGMMCAAVDEGPLRAVFHHFAPLGDHNANRLDM